MAPGKRGGFGSLRRAGDPMCGMSSPPLRHQELEGFRVKLRRVLGCRAASSKSLGPWLCLQLPRNSKVPLTKECAVNLIRVPIINLRYIFLN